MDAAGASWFVRGVSILIAVALFGSPLGRRNTAAAVQPSVDAPGEAKKKGTDESLVVDGPPKDHSGARGGSTRGLGGNDLVIGRVTLDQHNGRDFLYYIPHGYKPEPNARVVVSFRGTGETIQEEMGPNPVSDFGERGWPFWASRYKFAIVIPAILFDGCNPNLDDLKDDVLAAVDILTELRDRGGIGGRWLSTGWSAGSIPAFGAAFSHPHLIRKVAGRHQAVQTPVNLYSINEQTIINYDLLFNLRPGYDWKTAASARLVKGLMIVGDEEPTAAPDVRYSEWTQDNYAYLRAYGIHELRLAIIPGPPDHDSLICTDVGHPNWPNYCHSMTRQLAAAYLNGADDVLSEFETEPIPIHPIYNPVVGEKPPVSATLNRASPFSDNLKLAYLFNEGAGEKVEDKAGGHAGFLSGSLGKVPSWVSSIDGPVIATAFESGAYVNVPHDDDYSPNGPFTWFMVLRLHNYVHNQSIVLKTADSAWNNGWGFVSAAGLGSLRFWVDDWVTPGRYVDVGTDLFNSQRWAAIFGWYDGTRLRMQLTNNIEEFPNEGDEFVSSQSYTTGTGASTGDLAFAGDPLISSGGRTPEIELALFYLWKDRVLTYSERKALWEAPFEPFKPIDKP